LTILGLGGINPPTLFVMEKLITEEELLNNQFKILERKVKEVFNPKA
jgi:hypothetical protein